MNAPKRVTITQHEIDELYSSAKRFRQAYIDMLNVVYRGIAEHQETDSPAVTLRQVADWLDRVDDTTLRTIQTVTKTKKQKLPVVGRHIQEDLRELADELEDRVSHE